MLSEQFWNKRYLEGDIGWDLGMPSPPLKAYIDQLQDKNIRILIPGAGNGYEAAYLLEQGFLNVSILDISSSPLNQFQLDHPDFPTAQIYCEDFFDHEGAYDLILEQTFFCALPPTDEMRSAYAFKVANLLKDGGKLVGLWWDFPLEENQEKPPFGGNKEMYLSYLEPYFEVKVFDKAYNSVAKREDLEFFGIFLKSEV